MGNNDDSFDANADGHNNRPSWVFRILDCFIYVINMIRGHELRDERETSWEIPFESFGPLEYLGSGAQGVVFSARLNGEIVAVKKVRDKAEINVKHLRKLNHENIVRFRGICNVDPSYCVVMEYCQYGSLFDFLHSGNNLLPEQVMKWAKEISLGMSYLHANKIVHRDLKSPNVLISDNFTVKVSDFGTSMVWQTVNKTMSFTGTVAWMAPEIIRHDLCSDKIDVWSFGVVLWELLTRQKPYQNMEAHAIMWGVGTDALSLPIPFSCPTPMQVLLCQCWQRNPTNRPPFKIIAVNLEMATSDIVAIGAEAFAEKQIAWGEEVRETMKRTHGRCNESSHSEEPPTPEAIPLKPREDLRRAKKEYEQQICRANEIYMEVCAVRLQLEQRERILAEREKLLKNCKCGQNKNIKIQRQQSSTSSDSKPVATKQPRKQKTVPPAQLLVNYTEKAGGCTTTVVVDKSVCSDSLLNNNVNGNVAKKETVVEKNGNIEDQAVSLLKKNPSATARFTKRLMSKHQAI